MLTSWKIKMFFSKMWQDKHWTIKDKKNWVSIANPTTLAVPEQLFSIRGARRLSYTLLDLWSFQVKLIYWYYRRYRYNIHGYYWASCKIEVWESVIYIFTMLQEDLHLLVPEQYEVVISFPEAVLPNVDSSAKFSKRTGCLTLLLPTVRTSK